MQSNKKNRCQLETFKPKLGRREDNSQTRDTWQASEMTFEGRAQHSQLGKVMRSFAWTC